MRSVAGKFVEVLTGRTFLMMAGWALVSSAVSYASTSTTGLPWETPLQTVKQSLTGPVAAGISVVGIAAGVIATAVIVGAGTIMSTLFSSSSAVIAMTGGF
jgi:type IV secretion system protein VirB2